MVCLRGGFECAVSAEFPLLGGRPLTLIKSSFFIICEAIYYLSRRRLLCGPSIEVFANKPA